MNAFVAAKRLDAAFLRAHRTDALTAQNGYCKYCFEPLSRGTATAEHIRPKRHGGTNAKANIAASCAPCNRTKGSMSELAFKNAIKHPEGHSHHIQMAAFRRTMWTKVHRACGRIMASVGQKYRGPK